MYYIKRPWSPQPKTLFISHVLQRPLLSSVKNLNPEITVGTIKYPPLQFTHRLFYHTTQTGMVHFCILNSSIPAPRKCSWVQILYENPEKINDTCPEFSFSTRNCHEECVSVQKHCQDKLSQFAAGLNKWNVRRVRLKYQPSWLLGQAFKSQKTEILSRDIKLDNFPVHT